MLGGKRARERFAGDEKAQGNVVTPMKIEDLVGLIGSEFGDEVVDELLHRVRRGFDDALNLIRRPQAALGVVKSPLGDLLVATSARGIALNHFIDADTDLATTIAHLRLDFDPVEDEKAVGEIGKEVRGYLAGDADALRHHVDLTLAKNLFQQKVLRKLQDVPRGAVVSYQALGAAAGAPRGARAVGNALHNNPVPIYVPCHRVIAAQGRIGGYGGGLPRKLQLLRSEGFAMDNAAKRVPDSVVWGHKVTRIYCRMDCRTTARVDRNRILMFASPQEARRAGMRACKICHPDAPA
jgi:methylated-DNA-[protein]-cysteine S-methyltransferase